jgi:hypothetical protein
LIARARASELELLDEAKAQDAKSMAESVLDCFSCLADCSPGWFLADHSSEAIFCHSWAGGSI